MGLLKIQKNCSWTKDFGHRMPFYHKILKNRVNLKGYRQKELNLEVFLVMVAHKFAILFG